MGTDFKGRNIISPLPQRMVHQTNRDKEYTCLLKVGGKKEMYILFSFLRNLIKLQGSAWHSYVHPGAWQALGRAVLPAALQALVRGNAPSSAVPGCGHMAGPRLRALAGGPGALEQIEARGGITAALISSPSGS